MASHWSSRFTVEASEDLNSRIVTVKDDYGRLAFRKTRELIGEEVVESLVDASSQVVWTIHRPIRGYYLLLRSPLHSHSHSSFVSLRPSGSDRFTFSVEPSNVPSPSLSGSNASSASPKPNGVPGSEIRHGHGRSGSVSAVNVDGLQRRSVSTTATANGGAPSPRFPLRISVNGGGPANGSGHVEDEEDMPTPTAATAPRSLPPPLPSLLSFVVAPTVPITAATIFDRLSALFIDPPVSFACFLSSSSPSSSSSSPLLRTRSGTGPPSASNSPALSIVSSSSASGSRDDGGFEVFRYTDASSRFRLRSSGTLTVAADAADAAQALGFARGLGTGFWVAVALAYLEYREDKEAYTAASEDVE